METRPRVLLCPPDQFGIEYVINPWMVGHLGHGRRDAARAEWARFRAAIEPHCEVLLLGPAPGLPDLCFTANLALVHGEQAVLGRFAVAERRPEESIAREWLTGHGWHVVQTDEPLEGEGDALFQPGEPLLWAGYGIRSALPAHAELVELLGVEAVSLRLTDERFYHLDMALLPLPGGRLVWYPPAFDEPSRLAVAARIDERHRLAVTADEALAFACNGLRLGTTIFCHQASPRLRDALGEWGYALVELPLDEFLLAGGAAKCLALFLDQTPFPRPAAPPAPAVAATRLRLTGHLLDGDLLNRVTDEVTAAGGSLRVEALDLAARHAEPSTATLHLAAPSPRRLEALAARLLAHGAELAEPLEPARLVPVVAPGVAPEEFYSTTIWPTDVLVGGRWLRARDQRMDAVLVVEAEAVPPLARCVLLRDLRPGQLVVCGARGVRVHATTRRATGEFAFMRSEVSSERRVERVVDELAWELQRIRARSGRTVVVAGPVVVHTGGGPYLARLIRDGYVQAVLAGNALAVHDLEQQFFGTSLGVDLARGVGVHGGHRNHLTAINRIRATGGIAEAVSQGMVTAGICYECVRAGIPLVLAGSIRDDGPLPETLMDLVEAQRAYAEAIRGADLILMLASMLHAIGTGNMTPAGVKLVAVDISPAVVTKLADRGSVESVGVVTDVGLFLNLLARRLGR